MCTGKDDGRKGHSTRFRTQIASFGGAPPGTARRVENKTRNNDTGVRTGSVDEFDHRKASHRRYKNLFGALFKNSRVYVMRL